MGNGIVGSASDFRGGFRRVLSARELNAPDEFMDLLENSPIGEIPELIVRGLGEPNSSDISRAIVMAIAHIAKLSADSIAEYRRLPLSILYNFTTKKFKFSAINISHVSFKKTLDLRFEAWLSIDGNSADDIAGFLEKYNITPDKIFGPDAPVPDIITFEHLRESPYLFVHARQDNVTQTTILLRIFLDESFDSSINFTPKLVRLQGWYGIDHLIKHAMAVAGYLTEIVTSAKNPRTIKMAVDAALDFLESKGAAQFFNLHPDFLANMRLLQGTLPRPPEGLAHTEYYKGFKDFLIALDPHLEGILDENTIIDDYFSKLMAYNIQWIFRHHAPDLNINNLTESNVLKIIGRRSMDTGMVIKEVMACILVIYKEVDEIILFSGSDLNVHVLIFKYFSIQGSSDIFMKLLRRQTHEHGYFFEVRVALIGLCHFPAEKILLQATAAGKSAQDMIILAKRSYRKARLINGVISTYLSGIREVGVIVQLKSYLSMGKLLRLADNDPDAAVKGDLVEQLLNDVYRLMASSLDGPDGNNLGLVEDGYSNVIHYKLDWYQATQSVSERKYSQIREAITKMQGIDAAFKTDVEGTSNAELLHKYMNQPEKLLIIQRAFKKVYFEDSGALAAFDDLLADFEQEIINNLMRNSDGAQKSAAEVRAVLIEKFQIDETSELQDFNDIFEPVLATLDSAEPDLDLVEKSIRVHFRNRFNCGPSIPEKPGDPVITTKLRVNIDFVSHHIGTPESFLGDQ